MVITKQKPIVNVKNIRRKESKHTTIESHQATNGETREEERDREITQQPENNEQNGNKYIPINNYFKCKME